MQEALGSIRSCQIKGMHIIQRLCDDANDSYSENMITEIRTIKIGRAWLTKDICYINDIPTSIGIFYLFGIRALKF